MRVVVILKGKFAGRKGIIVKSNYEGVKDKKFPHCLVVGLSKGPRKATKRSLKKLEDKIKAIEANKNVQDSTERIAKLKKLGVFIKTYNMSHLLVTRYSLKDDFGSEKCLSKLDGLEINIKTKEKDLHKKEHEKKEENKKAIEDLTAELGKDKDEYRKTLRDVKNQIGNEMMNRFMQGFVQGNDKEENERQENTQFLFKKLQF